MSKKITKKDVKNEVFKNAPITEALLDIRVNLASDFNPDNLEKLYEEIKKDFPIKQVNTLWEAVFEAKRGEKPQVSSNDRNNGYLFKSQDGSRIFQARIDGFTFNRLKPYDSWDGFSGEAKKLWNLYSKFAKPEKIKRLALRYINLIEIPQSSDDLSEYFITGPDIAPGLPQGLADFFVRLMIPDHETKNVAIINETVDKSKLNDKIFPLIFDVDVFRVLDQGASDKEVWEIFESLRDYKDKIFMNSFTEKAKKLFR